MSYGNESPIGTKKNIFFFSFSYSRSYVGMGSTTYAVIDPFWCLMSNVSHKPHWMSTDCLRRNWQKGSWNFQTWFLMVVEKASLGKVDTC